MATLKLQDINVWDRRSVQFEAGGYELASWVHYHQDTDRPWLLLIHGFPTSSWDWSALWPALAQHFSLAAIDMLGFGLSEKPRNIAYSLMAQTDFQEAFLAELGVPAAHIFAHDYGVSVAQELLARHNEQSLSFSVQSVCFLNGGLFPEQHRARLLQKLALTPLGPLLSATLSRKTLEKSFNEIFGPNTQATDDELEGYWHYITHKDGQRVLHKLMRYIHDRRTNAARWKRALIDAHAPLYLINGGCDPVSGKHLYDYYRETIPNANAVLLEDIGHYPHTEAPDQIWQNFANFHHLDERIPQ